MDEDPPLGNVEHLDEWDDEVPTPRRTRTWLIGPLALVAVVAIVAAVVLGGTKQAAVEPVPSPTPTATPVLPNVSTTALANPGSTYYVTVNASAGSITAGPDQAYTPDPIPSDAEEEPLLVSLVDKQPRTSAGMVSFNVRVCVSARSAAPKASKVRVSRSGWLLTGIREGTSPMETGGIAPEFPEATLLAAGQCVSGYVSFPTSGDSKYIAINYGDERFSWSWRVS